ncbi:MAG: FHA domain-containing protein [SAR324 cluster bacterium]|nr:FHA domain-containing protein [SAR324 cluster bacterium]
MNDSLKRLGLNSLMLGALSGVWGASLYRGMDWLTASYLSSAASTVLTGMAMGLGLCALLASVEDLYNRFWRRAGKTALTAGLLGLVVGGAGFGLAWLLLTVFSAGGDISSGIGAAHWVFIPLLMGLFGGAAGMGSGLSVWRPRRGARRGLTGLGAGALLGLPLTALLALAPEQGWLFEAAFASWGALMALIMFWGERKTVRHWLRILTGPGADSFFPLRGSSVTLGKLESNDIPLLYYQEIFPFHCQLRWEADHYKIVDREQGGMVLVNYRQIHEQDLKHGDLVKLGTALLQYGEAS